VRAFVRERAGAAGVLPPEVELFEGDLAQRAAVRAAMQGIERLFLLTPVHEHMEDFERSVIEEARDARIAHVVKFSAIGAHPGSKTFFGRVHGRAEAALVASGIPYTILQPSFFMQNSLWSADTIKRDGAIYNATGTGAAGHVDAQDTASVAAAALTEPIERHAGEIYLVTGPERLTFADIAERFTRVLGRSVRHVDVPAAAYKDTMIRQAGMPEWQAQGVLDLEIRCRVGDFSPVTDTVERVGKRRPTTFEEFIRQRLRLHWRLRTHGYRSMGSCANTSSPRSSVAGSS
jgi:uncharacterized protein YbjT (DUF2867 family)